MASPPSFEELWNDLIDFPENHEPEFSASATIQTNGIIHEVRRARNGEVYVVGLEYPVPDASQGPGTVNATSTSSDSISEPQGAIWSTLRDEEERGSEKGDLVPLVGCVFTQGEEWVVPCTAPIIKIPPGGEPMCEQHYNAWKEWKSRALSTSRQLGPMGQQQRHRRDVQGGGFQALSELAEAGKAPSLEDISTGKWKERYMKGVYD
ncbi:hypothetical protein QFC21_004057 [Naganishia friedmannii]|uniref:Uncharacterized protein n=1 Tax=Naganishia friedmannii TaxID=89922 RepID=A0ACC2VJS3_9TREE|nr:hypothetical protein QFC21_004057 [Naganishia friedmannii]